MQVPEPKSSVRINCARRSPVDATSDRGSIPRISTISHPPAIPYGVRRYLVPIQRKNRGRFLPPGRTPHGVTCRVFLCLISAPFWGVPVCSWVGRQKVWANLKKYGLASKGLDGQHLHPHRPCREHQTRQRKIHREDRRCGGHHHGPRPRDEMQQRTRH